MDNIPKLRALLISYGASNHMVSCKDSFTTLESDNCISIHMGDDSQVSSKGKGTIQLEYDSFKNVIYVPYLASKLLSMHQMTCTSFPKRFVFILDDVEIY